MRILSIRGENLASLGGSFEVRLDADPLSTSGVFAIVGDTGAGKTTILDAACLGLFDATPRFEERGGALIGHEDDPHRLPANDVRNILRKGCGSASAEVEFLGTDGERYTATWSVRRAHRRPDGSYQNQKMTVVRTATGEHLAHGKSAVKKAIEDKLGLTFEQARRSMLLAQGDFAAFLKASGDARASLLEKVTGTFIYSRLGAAAHERAREARDAQKELETRAGEHTPLTAAARAELEAQLSARSTDLEGAKKHQHTLAAADAWRQQGAKLGDDVAKAGQHLQDANDAAMAATDLREELGRAERLERHRPVVQSVDRAEQDERRAHAERIDAIARLRTAEEDEAIERKDASLAARAAAAAAKALEDASPNLRRAHALDAQLTALADALAEDRVRAEEQRAEGLELAGEYASLPRARADAAAQLASAEAWLTNHVQHTSQVEQWDRLRAELIGLRDVERKLEAFEEQVAGASGEVFRLGELAGDARARAVNAEADLEAAQTEVETATANRDELFAGRDLHGERTALETERRRIEGLLSVAQADAANEVRISQWETTLAEEEVKLTEAGRMVAARDRDRSVAQATRDASRRAYERARAQLELSDHRAELRPGEPCPLCGSEEHPLAGLTELPELVATFAEDRDAADAAFDAAQAQFAEATATVEAQVVQLADKKAIRDEMFSERSRLADQWVELSNGRALPSVPREAVDPLEHAVARQRGAERDLNLAQSEELESRRLVDAKIARRDEARAHLDVVRAEADSAETSRNAKLGDLATLRASIEAREEARNQRLGALDHGLPGGWRVSFEADADALIRSGDDLVENWWTHARLRDSAVDRTARLEERETALAVQLARVLPRFSEACSDIRDRAEAVAALREERSSLFDGRAAEEIESELRAAVRTANDHAAAASESHRTARETLVQNRTEARHAECASQKATTELGQVRMRLDDLLREQDLELTELRRVLDLGPAWFEDARSRIRALDDAVNTGRTRLEERTTKLTEHHATQPDVDLDTLDAALTAAQELVEAAEAEHATVRSAVAQDEQRRQKTASLLDELEQAEGEVRRWETMNELIGGQNGRRFRTFAQSLTLDHLLQYANRHLEELHPRYQLQRVSGADLELQVIDRDMGGEIRGVKSLSGGETFLTSLALALGLASLSGSSSTVETLFIDEGFGTLDPECLEMVLEVLDGLQASGRQVGVISHVGAIAERFSARVEVRDLGGGRSEVRVTAGSGCPKAAALRVA